MSSIRRLKRRLTPGLDRFLGSVNGVIHVGANTGSERTDYAGLGLDVLWVEPIPEVAATLRANLRDLPRQRAVECLLSDVDDEPVTLNVANNRGASSSMLEFKAHAELWPDVEFVEQLDLTALTLPTMLHREQIALDGYDALVLDTQGAELKILQGAAPVVKHFSYIKAEAPDFEAYVDCPRVADISSFMSAHGFTEHTRRRFAGHASVGSYYDIVYRNTDGRH